MLHKTETTEKDDDGWTMVSSTALASPSSCSSSPSSSSLLDNGGSGAGVAWRFQNLSLQTDDKRQRMTKKKATTSNPKDHDDPATESWDDDDDDDDEHQQQQQQQHPPKACLSQHSKSWSTRRSLSSLCTVSTAASSDEEEEEEEPTRRRVRFSHVRIRTHEVVLGDNPACSIGPPIQLGWDYLGDCTVDLEVYHGKRTHFPKKPQRLEGFRRKRLVREAGFSLVEIRAAERQVVTIRRRRLETRRRLERDAAACAPKETLSQGCTPKTGPVLEMETDEDKAFQEELDEILDA